MLLAGCGGGSGKAGGQSGGGATVLTLAELYGPGELDSFARAVERLSGGSMHVETRYAWRSGDVAQASKLIDDVRSGRVDLAAVPAGAWGAAGVRTFDALSAPLLVNSYGLEERVLESSLVPRMLAGPERLGLVGLGVTPGPIHYPVGRLRPLVRPSQWTDLRIGTRGYETPIASLRALGATPVPLALDTRITDLDGAVLGIETLDGGNITVNEGFWPRATVLVANGKVFSALTRSQRDTLHRAAREAIRGAAAYDRGWRKTSVTHLCDQHARFIEASGRDLGALRRVLQPVYDELERDRNTRAQVAAIQTMRASVAPDPVPVCSPPVRGAGGRESQPGATRLDGSYTVAVSGSDVAHAIGRGAASLHSRLSVRGQGPFTLTLNLARGAWRVAEAPDGWVLTGSYSLRGSLLTLVPDGMSQAGGWSFRPSTFRGGLTLAPARSQQAPYWATLRVWRRTGQAVNGPLPPRASQPLPPDGVYRSGISIAGLLRAGVDPREAQDNGGPKLLIVNRGRYEIKWLRNAQVDKGSYRTAGNRTAFRFDIDRHDWLAARWTYARGRLHFSDIVSPEGLFLVALMGGAPWTKVQ